MKRVLVISNNCFSKTNSNGRTLGNLFYSYDKDKLAQFYISGNIDTDFCNNYFNVTDNDVINSLLLHKKKMNNKVENVASSKSRNCINMILRNFIWNLGFWKNKELLKWLDDFNPECILIQVGDCAFMIKFALWCAKRFNAKLFIFNSEGYYFKDYNYFRDGHDMLYKFFISNYKKWFKRIIKQAECSIYLCDQLKEDYDEEFHKKSIVIYNSSSLELPPITFDNFPVFSYIGNLGLGRDQSLCDVADEIQNIDKLLKINVYGTAEEETVKLFESHEGIIYHGPINYDEVKLVMSASHVLLHVESFDSFYVNDTKYGFSGKIADILASKRLFFVYAPESIACVKYLRNNRIALVATNRAELVDCLKTILSKENIDGIVSKQTSVFLSNHSRAKNEEIMQSVIK